ncbi:MAG: protein translocase subunit SecF [Candidatus Altimarinota bacterium]
MKNRNYIYSGLIVLSALLLGFYNLPGEYQKQVLPFLPASITDSKINLGLDLQGGSQLDYKVDLRKVPESDQGAIIDGIISVIQKRVNGIGVAEPNIYGSVVGDEKHIIVELAGIKDLEEAKATVGKTIQLEFKEQKTEVDPNEAAAVRETAQADLDKLKAGADFKLFGEEQAQANPGKVIYNESSEFQFKDELSSSIAEQAFAVEPGKISEELIDSSNGGEFVIDTNGSLVQQSGYNIIKVLEKQTVDRPINEPRKVKFAQILIGYKGLENGQEVNRTEEEAKKRADEVLAKLKEAQATPTPAGPTVEGQSTTDSVTFESLAKEYSDDTASKDANGVVATPVSADDGTQTKEVESTVLAFQNAGETSELIKSPVGYHILKAVEITDAKNETIKEDQVKVARIFYSSTPDSWQETGLNGQFFQRADVIFNQVGQANVQITFNTEGGKLFEELTERNVNKPIAIFVGGNMISSPNVNEKISGGLAIISGNFSIREAEELARDLNTGAIPAPIILVGQYNIGASLGQEALNNSLIAGAIGLGLILLFLVLYYRLAGLLAFIALMFYTALFVFMIKCSLPMWISLPISLGVFIFLIAKILNSKDSGPEKLISLVLACFILFFLSFLLSTQLVLTLAGIAGVILSIGMAVDANILIFERIKEELRDGRTTDSAIEIGFDRAWTSIKDSNFSSLITCAILFYFGSSIIQGFAFNLAAGILVSMFSAITISKILLHAFIPQNVGDKSLYFGTPKKKDPKILPVIAWRKAYYAFSAILIGASIIGFTLFGLRSGLDFTGGSLMELKFADSNVTTEQVQNSLKELETQINQQPEAAVPASDNSTPAAELTSVSEPLDLHSALVITSEEGIIIKSKTLSAEQHDQVIAGLKAKHGEVEETRFQSVGPTVGESLRFKAIIAILIATFIIVLYIAFAFRKVPKSIGKWNFGFAAIVALLHDIIIMVGIYVLFGVFFNVEIDALFITALLTTMGFSVHDTIVVLDRLREKLKAPGKDRTFADLTNEAVNETLARSINTSVTTALALLSLAILGGESIRFFNIALLLGIVVGTYSSIFVASALLVYWHNFRNKNKKS